MLAKARIHKTMSSRPTWRDLLISIEWYAFPRRSMGTRKNPVIANEVRQSPKGNRSLSLSKGVMLAQASIHTSTASERTPPLPNKLN